MEKTIGLEGSGAGIELKIIERTDKAYCVETKNHVAFWMPRYVFNKDGLLKDEYFGLYEKNHDCAFRSRPRGAEVSR